MSTECRGHRVWETRHKAPGRGRKGVQRTQPFARVWGVPAQLSHRPRRRRKGNRECRGRSSLPGTLSGGQVIRGVPAQLSHHRRRRRENKK